MIKILFVCCLVYVCACVRACVCVCVCVCSNLPKTVPLIDHLMKKAAEYSAESKSSRKSEDDNGVLNARRTKNSNKCGGNADGNFIPTQGALLDQYGPG